MNLYISPGIVLSSRQAKSPAINTGLAINIEMVSSIPSFPEATKSIISDNRGCLSNVMYYHVHMS